MDQYIWIRMPGKIENYSNLIALKALVIASIQSIFKSPSAIFFGIGFPLIFILVFGFLGGGNGALSIHVVPGTGSDTSNYLYQALKNVPALKWDTVHNIQSENKKIQEGDLDAAISIVKKEGKNAYHIKLKSAGASMSRMQALRSIIKEVMINAHPELVAEIRELGEIEVEQLEFREYKNIDFILPGQLGFSLLSGSIFGTAFVFYNMRQTLVLKRFFATPVRREVIVLSEGIARMLFQIMSAVIIIIFGHYMFDFTLLNGLITALNMVFLCALSILVFMAIGFIISGLVKNDASIPAFANIIVLPQVFLAGTFFPVSAFPQWLQYVSKAMPLKYLNDALRKVSFDGANLWEVRTEILVLLSTGIFLYAIAGRVFKWE